jgi:hypothetical protein
VCRSRRLAPPPPEAAPHRPQPCLARRAGPVRCHCLARPPNQARVSERLQREGDEFDFVVRCRVGHAPRRSSAPLCRSRRLAPPAAVLEMPCVALPRPRSGPAAVLEMPRAARCRLGDALRRAARLWPARHLLLPPGDLDADEREREEERMKYEGRG